MSRGPASPNCLNCDAVLHGRFCHECGQKATHPVLGVHDFAHEVTHEFLHLDGKIWRTVKLLVAKPGELTREFIAGHRARYISPVRVYLTFSVLFSGGSGAGRAAIDRQDRAGGDRNRAGRGGA